MLRFEIPERSVSLPQARFELGNAAFETFALAGECGNLSLELATQGRDLFAFRAQLADGALMRLSRHGQFAFRAGDLLSESCVGLDCGRELLFQLLILPF